MLRTRFVVILITQSVCVAQVSSTLDTSSSWRLTANAGTQITKRSVPSGTRILNQLSLDAAAVGSQGRRANARLRATKTGNAFSIDTQTSAWAPLSIASAVSFGGGRLRLLSSATSARRGKLVVRVTGQASGSSGIAQISIANRTVWTWTAKSTQQTKERSFPLTIQPSVPLSVFADLTATSQANGFGVPFTTMQVDMRFERTPCTATAYGSSCATASASFPMDRKLELRGSNGVPRGFGLSIAGLTRRSLTLPFPSCTLLLDPFVTLAPYRIDALGKWSHRVDMPPFAFRFLIQDGQFNANLNAVRTTNAFEIHCEN